MKRGPSRTFFVSALMMLMSSITAAQDVEVVTSEEVVSDPPSDAAESAVVEVDVTQTEPLASEAQQRFLGAWLEYTASTARRERRLAGANQLVASGLLFGLGSWGFVRSDPATLLDKGLALSAVILGGVFFSVGVFQLAKESDSERRFERWQKATATNLSLRELGRFEGELRSQSERAERALRVGRWTSFGSALTGGLILGLTPVADLSSDGETIGYAIGGVMAAFGFLNFGLSFVGAKRPSYWELYQRGQGPTSIARNWSAAPAIGRKYYGASLVGRF